MLKMALWTGKIILLKSDIIYYKHKVGTFSARVPDSCGSDACFTHYPTCSTAYLLKLFIENNFLNIEI